MELGCYGPFLFKEAFRTVHVASIADKVCSSEQIWNLLENRDLFTDRIRPDGIYNPAAHLAEMIALLGPPPQTLIMNRVRSARQWTWSPLFENREGKICERVEEYYGGPFWDYRTGKLFLPGCLKCLRAFDY